MSKRYRRYDRSLDDCEIKDGESVHVYLTDAQRNRRTIADAVARSCAAWAGHRPGPIADGLPRALLKDGAYDCAQAMRAQALADLEHDPYDQQKPRAPDPDPNNGDDDSDGDENWPDRS